MAAEYPSPIKDFFNWFREARWEREERKRKEEESEKYKKKRDKKKETKQEFNIVRTYLHDNIDIELLKDVLDELLNLHREFRYELKIYNNSKYPLTNRINKKRKKVITKRQTKMLSLWVFL